MIANQMQISIWGRSSRNGASWQRAGSGQRQGQCRSGKRNQGDLGTVKYMLYGMHLRAGSSADGTGFKTNFTVNRHESTRQNLTSFDLQPVLRQCF